MALTIGSFFLSKQEGSTGRLGHAPLVSLVIN